MPEAASPWDIPRSWEPALRAAAEGGVLLLVGDTNSGKSTLAAVLADAALRAGRRVAVVDADVGQSSIGPPACVSMALLTDPVVSLEELAPGRLEFVGAPTPVGHLLPAVAGAGVLAEAARRSGAETLIVDTTGLIEGPVARALKGAKVQLLQPDYVVALQRDDEAEHLLAPYRGRARPQVLRLRPSRRVKERSREQRTTRRKELFARYFASGREAEVAWEQVPMEGTMWTTGRMLPGHLRAHVEEVLGVEVLHAESSSEGLFAIAAGPADTGAARELRETYGGSVRAVEAALFRNLLVGLLGERGETLALGILEGVDYRARRLHLFTPLREVAAGRGLRLGTIQLGRDGTQLAWLEPGDLG
jgi:polynucleotide 5'-hydroxyl-kinase GRC3/NOL9